MYSVASVLGVQEYLFRGIQKSEWQNLFSFIQAKRLRIENLREAELGPAGGGGGNVLDLGDDIDTGAHNFVHPPQEQWHAHDDGFMLRMRVHQKRHPTALMCKSVPVMLPVSLDCVDAPRLCWIL